MPKLKLPDASESFSVAVCRDCEKPMAGLVHLIDGRQVRTYVLDRKRGFKRVAAFQCEACRQVAWVAA